MEESIVLRDRVLILRGTYRGQVGLVVGIHDYLDPPEYDLLVDGNIDIATLYNASGQHVCYFPRHYIRLLQGQL